MANFGAPANWGAPANPGSAGGFTDKTNFQVSA